VETEVAVEGRCIGIDRVHDDGTRSKLSPATHAAPERIDQQITAEARSTFGAVERKPRKQHDGNRIRHASPKPTWRVRVGNGAHRERVVAND
jgi:hypothetical protein